MNHFLSRNENKIKHSQRLKLISAEARRIRELHEAGTITALEAAKLLMELRQSPESVLWGRVDKREHSAA